MKPTYRYSDYDWHPDMLFFRIFKQNLQYFTQTTGIPYTADTVIKARADITKAWETVKAKKLRNQNQKELEDLTFEEPIQD